MKIYCAGSYSASNVIQVLKNIREGIKMSAKLLKMGYAVFCPWLDHQFLFYADLSVQQLRDYSMSWLEVSDAVFVLPHSELSVGTQAEIKQAKEWGIPVVFSLRELKKVKKNSEIIRFDDVLKEHLKKKEFKKTFIKELMNLKRRA